MRKWAALVFLAGLLVSPAAGRAEAALLAACSENARATSVTYDDPGEECSDFFVLDAPATVVVRLEPGSFNGTLGAALMEGETSAATFKRTFVAGDSVDGPIEMTVTLPVGNWRLRAFAGVTPLQPCAPPSPVYPGLVPTCSLVPGAGLGNYSVTVRPA